MKLIRNILIGLMLSCSGISVAYDGDRLVDAAVANDITYIKNSISNGADVNTTNLNNVTLLMAASIKGHADLVEFLLNSGADPNIVNSQGVGPLYAACMMGYPKIVRRLLENGADPNSVIHAENATPLMIAVANYRKEIVRLLLKNGAKVDIKNPSDKTAAQLSKHDEMVRILNKHNNGH